MTTITSSAAEFIRSKRSASVVIGLADLVRKDMKTDLLITTAVDERTGDEDLTIVPARKLAAVEVFMLTHYANAHFTPRRLGFLVLNRE